jgi:RNA polymerase sigma-70 factor (ECF subfamily)
MQHDGKASEFLRLFLDQRDRLEFFIFRRVGCHATAADLMQELFLRLWGRPIARPEESAGYLYRSARNLVIDHQRSQRMRARHGSALLPEQQAAAPASPEAAVAARDELALVEDALRALPARTRQVFLLNKVHQRSYGEIARAFGVSVSTIEKDMMRALAACKARLAEIDEGG